MSTNSQVKALLISQDLLLWKILVGIQIIDLKYVVLYLVGNDLYLKIFLIFSIHIKCSDHKNIVIKEENVHPKSIVVRGFISKPHIYGWCWSISLSIMAVITASHMCNLSWYLIEYISLLICNYTNNSHF